MTMAPIQPVTVLDWISVFHEIYSEALNYRGAISHAYTRIVSPRIRTSAYTVPTSIGHLTQVSRLPPNTNLKSLNAGKCQSLGKGLSGFAGIANHYVPLNVSYFHPTGVFAKFGATYVDQEAPVDPSSSHDRFWTVDAAIGYRLPKRYGLLSLDIKNLFDEEFTYQNSFNAGAQRIPRFQPSRAVFARINLWMF